MRCEYVIGFSPLFEAKIKKTNNPCFVMYTLITDKATFPFSSALFISVADYVY